MQQNRWIEVTGNPIAPDSLLRFVTTSECGAVVLFLGTVRELTAGRRSLSLEYEAYPEMAVKKMHELAEEACRRWPVAKVAIVHRVGHLQLTEASLAIAVSSLHRRDSFEAGQFLIDELKVRVPIWKKEHWEDGSTEWIHPEQSSSAEPG